MYNQEKAKKINKFNLKQKSTRNCKKPKKEQKQKQKQKMTVDKFFPDEMRSKFLFVVVSG